MLIIVQARQIGFFECNHERATWASCDAQFSTQGGKATMRLGDEPRFECAGWRIKACMGNRGICTANALPNIAIGLNQRNAQIVAREFAQHRAPDDTAADDQDIIGCVVIRV